jgi:YebC/PmpR family DNA-binding regulatory protein
MSGHSHWKTIKFRKGAADAKKGKVFSKISREITLAARDGGGDLIFNTKLRMIVEKARSFNMPTDNIDRSIKKGTGELEGEKLEPFTFEAYGPGGIAILIDGITDNKNRAYGEAKQILSQHNGKIVSEGGVQWMFEKKGIIYVPGAATEETELLVIEAGADDVLRGEEGLEIFTKPEDSEKVRKNLETKGLKPDSVSLGWVAKENITVSESDKNANQKLFEALDENEDIQEIYSNLKD